MRACLERLREEDVWWRPNEASNAVGNLVLHLCGNLRQWVVTGLGGADDTRSRPEEFARREGASRADLIDLLEATLADAGRTLEALDPTELHRERTIQGTRVSGLVALYHAVEHFSMHAGQILWITKLRLGEGLGFYRVEGGLARPTWGGERPSAS